MSVEKPLGEVLFTLVMKQVPWNEVLQSSQEMLQYIYLYLSYIPYRLLSEAEDYLAKSGGQGNCTSAPPDRSAFYSYTGYTTGVLTETDAAFFLLCFKLRHRQQHFLKALLRRASKQGS